MWGIRFPGGTSANVFRRHVRSGEWAAGEHVGNLFITQGEKNSRLSGETGGTFGTALQCGD
jgi:hypothetical protein